MLIQSLFAVSLAATPAIEQQPEAAPVLDRASLKILSEALPGSSGWSKQEDGVYFGRMTDGSKVRLLTAGGMDVRRQELAERLSAMKASGTASHANHAWMQQELEALDRMPQPAAKSSQWDLHHASICGITHETRGTFSANYIPPAYYWVAGGSSIVKIPSFGPAVPPWQRVAHGWISHGVSMPSQGYSVGQFDDYFNVVFSDPVNGSWGVPEGQACDLQIDATISVACTAAAPTSYAYFSVTRWQTCEGVVAGSPINVW